MKRFSVIITRQMVFWFPLQLIFFKFYMWIDFPIFLILWLKDYFAKIYILNIKNSEDLKF